MDFSRLMETVRFLDWATISNVAVVISAFFVVRQLSEMRRTTHAQSYSVATQYLQDGIVRQSRKNIFHLKNKPLSQWTQEETASAELVCSTYDVVGQMVRHGLLPKDIIINSWGPSIRNSFPILLPLILSYREHHDAPEYWDDYEWLARAAKKADNWRRWRQRMLNHLKLNGLSSRFRKPIDKLETVHSPKEVLEHLLNSIEY